MAETTGRKAKTKKRFLDAAGRETRDLSEAASLEITVLGSGEEPIVVGVNDYPPNIDQCLRWFGVSVRLGNAVGGAKGANPSIAYDSVLGLHELMLSGEWTEEAGPRISHLVTAMVRYMESIGRTDVTEDMIREQFLDSERGPGRRKAAMAQVHVAALHAEVLAEVAAERAARAAEAASSVEAGDVSDLFDL